MVISRSQMTKQLEPGLGNKDLKRFKKVTKKTSNPIAKSLSNRLFTPKVVHSKKLYNRKKERNITLKAAAKKGD